MAVSNTSDLDTSTDKLPGLLSEASYWSVMHIVLCLDTLAGFIAAGANIITIKVYRKLGYADSTNISLTALAISDLGASITTIACVLAVFLPTIPNLPITVDIFYPFAAAPHVDFVRCSALITTFLSVERYLCVSFPLKIKSIITPRRTLVAMVLSVIAVFGLWPLAVLKNPLGWKFYPELNRSLFSVIPYTDPIIGTLFLGDMMYTSIVLPILTFSMVFITTILLALSLRRNKAWRDANKSLPTAVSSTGENKEAKALKMVMAIATVFIISCVPFSVHIIVQMVVPEFSLTGRYAYLYYVTGMMFLMVDGINCSANIVIYYNMSTKFRQATQNMFRRKVK